MKRIVLLLTAILTLSVSGALAQRNDYGTVHLVLPDKADNAEGKSYFIDINGKYVAEIRARQYVSVRLNSGYYHIIVSANYMPNGVEINHCTPEVAKKFGARKEYRNMHVQTGETYVIDISAQQNTFSNLAVFEKAVSKKRVVSKGLFDWTKTVAEPASVPLSEPAARPVAVASAAAQPATPAAPVAPQKTTPAPDFKKTADRRSMVDINIPTSTTGNESTYVLIIANEKYEFASEVNYAANDGKIFKEYCIKTLGVPERQIFYYENATFGKMEDGISKMAYCLNNFDGIKAIVYYCGHGIPDEKTGEAYLLPIDGKGTNTRTCYGLNELYRTLADTKAQSVTYFMDACFTGADKSGSMLVAARGVARAPKKEMLDGNTIVFSASSGDETAMTLKEEGHGLFTYYLLKKLQETNGEVTYGELADYIHQNVKKDAFLINEKPQTPVVATSPAVLDSWPSLKLK